MCLCLCTRLCWLIPMSGETRPDGAWRFAVFVVTELMMSFMKFIDPICMALRVPSPISLSFCHPHCPQFTAMRLPSTPRCIANTCTHSLLICVYSLPALMHIHPAPPWMFPKLPSPQIGQQGTYKLSLLSHSGLI